MRKYVVIEFWEEKSQCGNVNRLRYTDLLHALIR